MRARRIVLAGVSAAVLLLDGMPAAGQARPIGEMGLWIGQSKSEEIIIEQRREQNQVRAGQRAGIDKGIDWLSLGIGIAESARDFGEAFPILHPDDARFQPDYSPPGTPELPISCGERDDCMKCYERAQRELNFVRVQFERLRAIYESTKKMAETAIAFGDSVSGLHGAMGLTWAPERMGIQKSLDQLGQTYDRKYQDLLGSLKKALDEVSKCEAEHFDTPDWYNRFGFMYYEFMAARYSRR